MIFLLLAALVSLYYVFLALYALLVGQKALLLSNGATHTFAVVIPAHNEEETISGVLRSCDELEYPKDKYDVFVVADNCSDRTAEIVTESGVTCLERHDEQNRGKGFALAWGFEHILPEGHDAVIVLDADCHLDTHALNIFDKYLENGNQVLQTSYVASNPDASAMSYAVAVGNLIENELFYAPKSRLGLAVLLRGTGMVFRREVLQHHPWHAHSIVEDVEYSLRLIRNRVRVSFVTEVRVLSKFPVQQDQLTIQRMRWASGNLGFGKTQALKLIWEGIVRGKSIMIDAGWTLLVLSRPLVLLELFVALILGSLCLWFSPGELSNWLFAITWGLVVMQGLYFVLGIVLLGVNSRRMQLLMGVPALIVRLIVISLLGLIGVDKNVWARTPRLKRMNRR
jgi:cellulose synthase/poly-beta-1,6-N-acetylglucosamine synthase-like glycosyltransferase